MADTKISELPAKTELEATDHFVVAEGTTSNKKVSLATMRNEIGSGSVHISQAEPDNPVTGMIWVDLP